MTTRQAIPRKTIYRLSIYLRCLKQLRRRHVSSKALAAAAGVKSSQLRKDLTYFGHVGTRGLGYDVAKLAEMISDLLGTNTLQPVILVGVGNLGSALLSYRGFAEAGFEVVAAFDVVSAKRLRSIRQKVYPMEDLLAYVKKYDIRIAIITVPPSSAQKVVDHLVRAGITGILNFVPLVVQAPKEVTVHNVNLAIELENVSYFTQIGSLDRHGQQAATESLNGNRSAT